MTDRELMQQALEKLEFFAHMKSVSEDTMRLITALRERLAQPEMQPCAGRNCGSTNPNLHSAECFEDYEKATGMNQRKPLTNDRVWLEYMQLWPFRPNEEPTLAKDILRFARAIEQAHGIGEKPDAA